MGSPSPIAPSPGQARVGAFGAGDATVLLDLVVGAALVVWLQVVVYERRRFREERRRLGCDFEVPRMNFELQHMTYAGSTEDRWMPVRWPKVPYGHPAQVTM